MAFSLLKSSAISLTIFSSLIFFLLSSPSPKPHSQTPFHRFLLQSPSNSSTTTTTTTTSSCSSIHERTPQERCSFSLSHCHGDSNGLFNYASLHFCLFQQNPLLSIPSLSLILLFHFFFLVRTAQDHFSVVVTKLSSHLRLSPSTGAVTLLALGNGAPDVFASVAAVRGGHPRTGLGAILSAGTFVSALVVGFVAIHAAPFSVDPAPFVRDVFFYLVAAFALFYVYLSAEIFLWQAIGFVGFYVFFVGIVFWMDGVVGGRRGGGGGKKEEEVELGLIGEVQKASSKVAEFEFADGFENERDGKSGSTICGALGKADFKAVGGSSVDCLKAHNPVNIPF